MFLRPGNLFKDFFVEKKGASVSGRGRVKGSYNQEKAEHFLGILAGAQTNEIERFRQLEHPITHTITHKGRPKAKEGDRLVHGSRIFYVQGVDDPGELGAWAIYYAEERSDVDGNRPEGGSGEPS